MNSWLLRGLAFAAGMVIVRLVQGTLINQYATKAGLISIVLVALFAIAAAAIGRVLVDRSRPDEPRRRYGEAHDNVFDAASEDDKTGPIPGLRSGESAQEQTSAVATAERDAPTEAIDYPEDDGRGSAKA